MIEHVVAAALVAAITAPVFASSGYGPAPHYSPIVGAPASEGGQSALTVRAEHTDSRQTRTNADKRGSRGAIVWRHV